MASYGEMLEESATASLKMQKQLGTLCAQYGLTKSDLYLMSAIKRYGKLEQMKYIYEHGIDMKTLEMCYRKTKGPLMYNG